MVRRPTTLLAVTTLCLSLACTKKADAPPEQPNVVVITVDTLRADRLGCYGFERARTPVADRLASEGVRVEHAVAATPITLPSHATLFTGLYPPAHGVRDNGFFTLPEQAETLAERLSAQGYRTQAFVSAGVLHRRFGLHQGFDGYDDDLKNEAEPGMFRFQERSAERTVNAVLGWLNALPSETPFFLWLHLFDPHQPYAPPQEDAKASPTLYDGEIAHADRQVGRLVDALRERGELDETVLVFTADHGESLREHGEETHSIFIYESTVRVPLIFRYPPKLPSGRVYPGSVPAVDVMPTILGLLGLPPGKTQGVDLSAALGGRVAPLPREPYSESLHPELEFAMAPLYGLRADEWTYIRAPRSELYDRSKDQGETRNLLEEEDPTLVSQARAKATALDQRLDEILAAAKGFGIAGDVQEIDGETVEMLKALGYMSESSPLQGVEGMDPKDGVRAFNDLDAARQLALESKYEEAKVILRSLLKRVPKNASVRNLLAMCELRTGNVEGVEALYLESLAHEPRQPQAHVQLGRLYLKEGKRKQARSRFMKALEVDPTYTDAMLLLGYLEQRAGNTSEAKSWYERAIEVDPKDPAPYVQFGDFHFRQGDFAQAKSRYERALELDPGSFSAALQAGTSALRLGETEPAERHFLQASEIDTTSWKPFYNLACLRAESGDREGAIELLRQAESRGFDDPALLGAPCFKSL